MGSESKESWESVATEKPEEISVSRRKWLTVWAEADMSKQMGTKNSRQSQGTNCKHPNFIHTHMFAPQGHTHKYAHMHIYLTICRKLPYVENMLKHYR